MSKRVGAFLVSLVLAVFFIRAVTDSKTTTMTSVCFWATIFAIGMGLLS